MPPQPAFVRCALMLVLSCGCSCGEEQPGAALQVQPSQPTSSERSVAVDDLLLRTRREKRVPGKPEWLHGIDVDGDGRQEVLASTNSPGAVLLWRTPQSAPETIPVGDFPLRPTPLFGKAGAGALVAVASRAESTLVLFDLSRAGAARAQLELELPDAPMVLAEGLLDSARGPELLVVTKHGRLVRVGAAGILGVQALDSRLPRCATVLEPGVGLVVGFQESDRLELYAARPGSDELEHRGGFELPGAPRDLLGQDLDGDGDLELIALEGDQGGWIFGLAGAQLFAAEPAPLGFKTTPIPLRLRPLSEASPPSWALLAAKGVACELWDWTARGPERRLFSYAGQSPADLLLADADGNGSADLWVANRDAHTLSLLRMGDGGPLQPAKIDVGTFPNDLATGDLDGDGLEEVFVIEAKDQTIAVVTRSEGGLRVGFRVPTGPSPRAVACVDLDGDGQRDLVWLERLYAGTQLNLRLGDGKGALVSPNEFQPLPLGVGARDFVVEGFNGEPHRTLVAADPEGRRLWWVQVRGEAGGLAVVQRGELALPSPPRSIASVHHQGTPRAVAVAMPIAGDRSLVQVWSPQSLSAGGLEWVAVGETTVSGVVEDLASGDLDGDGTWDLVVLCADSEGSVGGRVAPLLLRGGDLRPLGLMSTGLRPQRILAADLSGDGRAEIFVSNLDSHNVNAWLAQATETGVGFRPLDDVGAGVGCIALGSSDLDGDGDLDLLVVDSGNDGVSVILNDTP